MEESNFLSIVHHGAATAGKTVTDFLSIRLYYEVFHFPPRIFPDLLPSFIDIFKSKTTDKTIFVYRAENISKFFRGHGWSSASFVDTATLTRDGLEGRMSIDDLTEATVGGQFCRRGTNFTDVGIPSLVALDHRTIYATIIFKYGALVKGLHVPSVEPRHGSRRDERRRPDGDQDRSSSRRRH